MTGGSAGFQTLRGAGRVNAPLPNNNNENCPPMVIRHIPHLPHAQEALSLLQRIHREFYPIVQQRGYRVVLLSELCCCGDGDDYNENGQRSSKRKKRKVSDNILGYNSSSGGVSQVRLRLRDPRNHSSLLPYEDVAGTMSHELAHCVHHNHSAQFYKLMDDIQEQHAFNMMRGLVAETNTWFSGEAHVLGGTKNGGALEAALARKRQQQIMAPPQRLGGQSTRLAPAQAAAMAAEARRARDEQWCQPCQPDVVEIEEEEVSGVVRGCSDHRKQDRKRPGENRNPKRESKRAAVPDAFQQTNAISTTAAIDLTASDDEDDRGQVAVRPVPVSKAKGLNVHAHDFEAETDQSSLWSCPRCTLVNHHPTLVCLACNSEKASITSTQQMAVELKRNDEIKHVKDMEVQMSEKEFGFNIYGTTRQKTAKMKHMT